MRLPWSRPEQKPPPIVLQAREQRERAMRVIEFYLPAIDPNEEFTPEPPKKEERPWPPRAS